MNLEMHCHDEFLNWRNLAHPNRLLLRQLTLEIDIPFLKAVGTKTLSVLKWRTTYANQVLLYGDMDALVFVLDVEEESRCILQELRYIRLNYA